MGKMYRPFWHLARQDWTLRWYHYQSANVTNPDWYIWNRKNQFALLRTIAHMWRISDHVLSFHEHAGFHNIVLLWQTFHFTPIQKWSVSDNKFLTTESSTTIVRMNRSNLHDIITWLTSIFAQNSWNTLEVTRRNLNLQPNNLREFAKI